jgi:hypothetical protein
MVELEDMHQLPELQLHQEIQEVQDLEQAQVVVEPHQVHQVMAHLELSIEAVVLEEVILVEMQDLVL